MRSNSPPPIPIFYPTFSSSDSYSSLLRSEIKKLFRKSRHEPGCRKKRMLPFFEMRESASQQQHFLLFLAVIFEVGSESNLFGLVGSGLVAEGAGGGNGTKVYNGGDMAVDTDWDISTNNAPANKLDYIVNGYVLMKVNVFSITKTSAKPLLFIKRYRLNKMAQVRRKKLTLRKYRISFRILTNWVRLFNAYRRCIK